MRADLDIRRLLATADPVRDQAFATPPLAGEPERAAHREAARVVGDEWTAAGRSSQGWRSSGPAFGRRPLLTAATVATIAVVLTVGLMAWDAVGPNPPRGIAATPEPLTIVPNGDTRPAAMVLAELADGAEISGVPVGEPTGTDHLVLHAWYLHSQIDDADDRDGTVSALQATHTESWIRQDGSGRQLQRDAPVEFQSEADRERWAADGGSSASDTTYAPGERSRMWAGRPPTDPVELRAWLTAGHPSADDSGFVLSRVADLMRERALTSRERAAVLRVVASLPDLRLTGETQDRAGRPGLAFTVRSAYSGLPTVHTVVIDSADGRVLSHEQLLTETAGRLNVRIPAVVSYENYLVSDFEPSA